MIIRLTQKTMEMQQVPILAITIDKYVYCVGKIKLDNTSLF